MKNQHFWQYNIKWNTQYNMEQYLRCKLFLKNPERFCFTFSELWKILEDIHDTKYRSMERVVKEGCLVPALLICCYILKTQ